MARSLLAFATIVLTSAAACAELKASAVGASADGGGPAEDAGASDAPSGTADAADAGEPDVGAPPDDFVCNDQPWADPVQARAECSPRTVRIVDPNPIAAPNEISIARTPAGRIGIVYNHESGPLSGEMRLTHFVPSTSNFTPTTLLRSLGPSIHTGFVSRIAAAPAPDTLRVVAHDIDDGSQSGDVVVVDLEGGKPSFTTPDIVESGVVGSLGKPAPLAIAVSGAGDTFVTLRIVTGGTSSDPIAKLAARRKPLGGSFSPLPDVATGLRPAGAFGTGETSLFIDSTDHLHLLYEDCAFAGFSTPRYHTLDDDLTWSYRRTLDNAVDDGLSGFSPRLVTFGNSRSAAFFFRRGNQPSTPSAELRLVTWVGSATTNLEIVAQGIPAEDPHNPRYRVAMAVDPWGLLHIALVTPSANSPDRGTLEYLRQTRGSSGWLTDHVDDNVVSPTDGALVDLLVDSNGRPHIAYVSGVDRKVRYATRYDR